ncbi:hypothetical protein G7046_g3522 [Stylonectria norvegica]|nr:hypothetical protein G7046_g3522 [Stylonectria norvegica]
MDDGTGDGRNSDGKLQLPAPAPAQGPVPNNCLMKASHHDELNCTGGPLPGGRQWWGAAPCREGLSLHPTWNVQDALHRWESTECKSSMCRVTQSTVLPQHSCNPSHRCRQGNAHPSLWGVSLALLRLRRQDAAGRNVMRGMVAGECKWLPSRPKRSPKGPSMVTRYMRCKQRRGEARLDETRQGETHGNGMAPKTIKAWVRCDRDQDDLSQAMSTRVLLRTAPAPPSRHRAPGTEHRTHTDSQHLRPCESESESECASGPGNPEWGFSGRLRARSAEVKFAVGALEDHPVRSGAAMLAEPLDQGTIRLDHGERV